MERWRSRWVGLLVLLMPLMLTPAAPVAAGPLPWQFKEFRIADTASDQFAPAVSGPIVVWSEQQETGAVIKGKHLLTNAEIDVASGRLDTLATRETKLAPAISGPVVVWQNRGINGDGGAFDRIMGRDLARADAPPFPISTTRSGQLHPAIAGTTVVWADNRRGNWDIFGYDLLAKNEFVITTRPGDQLWPAISGTRVVWADERDGEWRVVGKELTTGEEFAVSPASGNQTSPSISGNLIVWEDTRAGRNAFDIYGYDLARQQEFLISKATDYQVRPVVGGDLIVWEDYRSGERDLWGFDYRTRQEFSIVVASGVQWQPALGGNVLVWSDARSGSFGISGAWLRRGELTAASADPAFSALWRETDSLVADRTLQRSWQWGDAAFATGLEDYAEAPNGRRLVQYYDKSRMEINNPRANAASAWYITTGHLAKELITGRLQVGADTFETVGASDIPVAGDLGNTVGPTYAALAGLLSHPAGTVGAPIVESIDRTGSVRTIKPPVAITLAYRVPETNHAIAEPFWAYLNAEGQVRRGGRTTTERLFESPFFASGLPITEPYWTRIQVAGQSTDVLVQAFERRVLTYTPRNAPAWRVEMGNVGRHYYLWRYGN